MDPWAPCWEVGSASRNLETWAGASRMGNFPQPALRRREDPGAASRTVRAGSVAFGVLNRPGDQMAFDPPVEDQSLTRAALAF